MATVTKPVALDETLQATNSALVTQSTKLNDIIAKLQLIATALGNPELIGDTDISEIADGTITGAIAEIDGAVSDLKSALNDMLDDAYAIVSNNKLNSNSAIGKTASQINGQFYYFGQDKNLADYENVDPLHRVIVFCRTTSDSINGLTCQWLYDDDTVSSSYVTLNSIYDASQVTNKDHVVGIKFIAFSAGASLVISELGVKFTGTTSATDEDLYDEKYVSNRLDVIEENIQNIEIDNAIYVYHPEDAITLISGDGVMNTYGAYNTSSNTFKHATGTVVAGKSYKITGRTFGSTYPAYLWLDNNNAILSYGTAGDTENVIEYAIAPSYATQIVINYSTAFGEASAIEGTQISIKEYVDDSLAPLNKPFTGKTAVWYGTSIPAGQYDGVGTSYPEIVGKALGLTVINKAIGASSVRAGNFAYKTTEDPFGWAGVTSMQSLGLSMSLSSSEKQTMFNNWNHWKTIIPNIPEAIADNMNDTYANMYKNASYDKILTPYLDGTYDMPDVFIFDHGFNDRITGTNEELYAVPQTADDRTYFIGAMRFLFDQILTANPAARIILIGHYENIVSPVVAEAQTKLAELYDLPLEKLWDKTGWNMIPVQTYGAWVDGYWDDDALQTPTTITVHNRWLCDTVHPHSDKSGKATNFLADIHTKWLREQVI